MIREAVAGASAADDPSWLAESLGIEQLLALSAGDLAGADALTDRCVAAAEAAGTEWLLLAESRAATLARLRSDLGVAAAHTVGHDARSVVGQLRTGDGHGRGRRPRPRAWRRGRRGGGLPGGRGRLPRARRRHPRGGAGGRCRQRSGRVGLQPTPPRPGICGLADVWGRTWGAPLHPMAAFPHATARALPSRRALGDRFGALATEGASAPFGLDAVRVLAATALS